jgi:PAS domain S-box-containing protein
MQGDLTHRARIPNSDEIGHLAKAFNEMLDSLESSYQELQKLNQNLEALAVERTRALEEKVLELNRTTQRLSESEAKYRVIFENSHIAIYITTYNGEIVNCNDAFLDLFGYSREEITNLNAIALYSDPQDRIRFQQVIEKTGYVKDFELKLKKKDGSLLDCLLTAQVRYDQEGRVVGYHGIIFDITKLRRMERELRELNEKLEQKVKERTQQLKQTYEQLRLAQEQVYQAQKLESIGILAGGIAHDFNNLLATIIGNVSLAKMMIRPEDKIFSILTRAENTCLRAKDLTQQLLTFSRGGEPIKKIISINKIIQDSANIALKGSKVGCEFRLPENIWPIEADEGQMMQVFNNLFINAREAMLEGGTIKVQAENLNLARDNELQLPEGTYVKITIQDQGFGIAEENLPKIFDPFFTTKPTGTGLGLTIVYSIIKRHKGLIKITSKLGVGTTCQVYLPASHKEILVHRSKMESSEEAFKANLIPIKTNQRILVMDDEEDVQATIKAILTHLGFAVDCAPNGEETINLYKQAKATGRGFSAVIMDLTIKGGMGGKETIGELIKIDPQVKAIVSSGYADDPILTDFKKYGFCASISKPFRVEEIAKVLNSVLSAKADSSISVSPPMRSVY